MINIITNMAEKFTAPKIYSTLGNSQSLVPLAAKDVANSMGLTAGSYIVGDKTEGKDRFVDEFGTQGIWLFGIPFFKKVLDKTLFKTTKYNPEIDVRLTQNKDLFKKAIDLTENKTIKKSMEKVFNNTKTFKSLTVAKFTISTLATIFSYNALTKFRHKQTEKEIKKEFLKKQEKQNKMKFAYSKAQEKTAFQAVNKTNSKNPSFTGALGALQGFMFDPVKNLMIVDGAITTERFTHSRNPQDFMGYAIKEGTFWAFMYFAGEKIKNFVENQAEKKHNKSITLDAKVLEHNAMQASFKDGKVLKEVKNLRKNAKTDVQLYEYIYKNPENLVVRMAKKSGIIKVIKGTSKVDTQKYINMKNVKGIADKMEKLYGQYKTSNEPLDIFFKGVKKLKRASVIKNIGSCIAALGLFVPATMVLVRKLEGNKGFQVKKDIEAQLQKSGTQKA